MSSQNQPIQNVSLAEFNKAQSKIAFCKHPERQIFHSETGRLLENTESVIIWRAPIDIALQKLVSQSMRQSILYRSHYPLLADHPGQRRRYDTIRADFYCLNLLQDGYRAVSDYHICARNGALWKHHHRFELFTASAPLKFVATYNLVPLPRISKENHNVIFITERNPKRTRASPTA